MNSFNDFAGPHANIEARYYVTPHWAAGLQYKRVSNDHSGYYLKAKSVMPTVTYLLPFKQRKMGLAFSLGAGYMKYKETSFDEVDYKLYEKKCDRDMCGFSLGVDFEVAITKNISGIIRTDLTTAGWHADHDGQGMGCDTYFVPIVMGVQIGI